MSDTYVPEGWDHDVQRFIRDDEAEDNIVSCFVIENIPVDMEEESEKWVNTTSKMTTTTGLLP